MITENGRRTPERKGIDVSHPVAAGALIYTGALVVLAGGFAEPASSAVGLLALGRAEGRADNSTGVSGDKRVVVRQGVHAWENDATDPVDRTHIGAMAYMIDDDTVAATDAGGTLSAAGTIVDIDEAGVWVDHRRL